MKPLATTNNQFQEQELLNSGDPQFAHYGGPLHVKVETTAAPAIAYQRVAGVLQILSELLIPVILYYEPLISAH